jgi:hypothetical protein
MDFRKGEDEMVLGGLGPLDSILRVSASPRE